MCGDMQQFDYFVNNIMQNTKDPMAVMLNGHTTFLMRDTEQRKAIHEHRMKWFIDNYLNYENIDKRPYYAYYQNHIKDEYMGVYNPPPCFYNEMIREERRQKELDQKEYDEYHNDDIAIHYRTLALRHLTRQDMMREDSECISIRDDDEFTVDDEYDDTSYMSYDEYYDIDDYEEYQSEYEEDDYDY
jgi:hypothetical protein